MNERFGLKETVALLAAMMLSTVPSLAETTVLATPGEGIGVAKLGMRQKKLKAVAGNFDVSYVLPSGVKVDRADWKDNGRTTMMLKVFYDKDGKAIQIATAGSAVVTADGINKSSHVGEIMKLHRHFKLTEFRAQNGRVDYYDDVKNGIAFQFRRLDDDLARKFYAIIVHRPGVPVLSDADENPLK